MRHRWIPKRVGLRYINRIAVPDGTPPEDWLALKLEAPSMLHSTWAFHLRQTWANIEGDEDLSASINLAKVAIDDPRYSEGHQGILLDIDVFNLWVRNAPALSAVPEWFQRAHPAENRIFEGCITDNLRNLFERMP
ncbi:MAG: TIGR04255 family protein [Gemmatimonadales bacterium]|nr:TIGR04255 family protein [Gemmatimonadales bacterium]MDQ3427681.1 TIGR04255 family protein [Gemmatimonadota bacterium]